MRRFYKGILAAQDRFPHQNAWKTYQGAPSCGPRLKTHNSLRGVEWLLKEQCQGWEGGGRGGHSGGDLPGDRYQSPGSVAHISALHQACDRLASTKIPAGIM